MPEEMITKETIENPDLPQEKRGEIAQVLREKAEKHIDAWFKNTKGAPPKLQKAFLKQVEQLAQDVEDGLGPIPAQTLFAIASKGEEDVGNALDALVDTGNFFDAGETPEELLRNPGTLLFALQDELSGMKGSPIPMEEEEYYADEETPATDTRLTHQQSRHLGVSFRKDPQSTIDSIVRGRTRR